MKYTKEKDLSYRFFSFLFVVWIHNAFVKIEIKLYVVEHISYKDVIFAAVI